MSEKDVMEITKELVANGSMPPFIADYILKCCAYDSVMEMVEAHNISTSAAAILSYLICHTAKGGFGYIELSLNEIGHVLNLSSQAAIRKYVAECERAGVITVKRQAGESNRYKIDIKALLAH